MKLTVYLAVSIWLLVGTYGAGAQSLFDNGPAGHELKGLDSATGAVAIVHTNETLFRTDDGGQSWRELTVPKLAGQTISHAALASDGYGYVLLSDTALARLEVVRSGDAGETWTRHAVAIPAGLLARGDLANATLSEQSGEWRLKVRQQTSSNFTGWLQFVSRDDCRTWELVSDWVVLKTEDNAVDEKLTDGSWALRTEGYCAGFKSGCIQETRLYKAGREVTPPVIKERLEREKARLITETAAAPPPGGSTRISLNRGFDKCTAAPVSQMRTWWDNSPHYDANIYMSGRNRGCSQGQLNAAWVEQVSAMGWGLIPTIVGYQAPCSVSTNSSKHSSDPATARTQGRGEADIAVADAIALGLTAGSVLYYDMERYDDLTGTGACSTPVKAFLEGWTERIHELGFKSGVYGSPTNAVGDWLSIPIAHRMDAIWMARWDNNPTVWSYAAPSPMIPTNAWNNHQRIKQWQAPHNETWGGVTFNIDGNISDGPVAGPAIAKNKNADFDGDGKSDISVFRPESGTWFVLSSVSSTFSALPFGAETDVIAPGDYDGDGKTDYAVFRPSAGIWHMSLKARTYSAKQWGANGDIPVPADFNGDGKTDLAVFRPSNGTWYIANSDSLATTSFIQFGQIGDKPVPGDYDGDGRADIAVYRPSNGVWYAIRSSNGAVTGEAFGISSDKPAQGDYDGDGKYDLAVYRDGIWYLLQSTAGFTGFQFGIASDIPSPGDFDGDGKTDMAVYRAADGVWYQQLSGSGFSGTGFGLAADRPVLSAYLPQ
ncbi:MAG TPA: glycoside hydrolase domain-containing protein [Pyrinomonadaceae bacterium]|nr:glycoside hydrolase domain-containing protein [Pyrinomonadaceae bacterium]